VSVDEAQCQGVLYLTWLKEP